MLLLKVTTYLYLKPRNRTSSLSTLIPVIVNKDTPQKVKATTVLTTSIKIPDLLLG